MPDRDGFYSAKIDGKWEVVRATFFLFLKINLDGAVFRIGTDESLPLSYVQEWGPRIPMPNEKKEGCEHGIPDGEWCEACNIEYKRAEVEFRKEASHG